MNLAVMGAGYVGLTTAICLASQNHRITIFDIDNEKIKQIQNKKLPFFENGLQEILEDVISSKNLVINSLFQWNISSPLSGCHIIAKIWSFFILSMELSFLHLAKTLKSLCIDSSLILLLWYELTVINWFWISY